MIKLTRLDGMATFVSPEQVALVTEARDKDGNTMTAVYLTASHPETGAGLCEYVREAPRHVARMCEHADLHEINVTNSLDEVRSVADDLVNAVAEKTPEPADSDISAITDESGTV